MLNPIETLYKNYKNKYGINALVDNKATKLFYIEKEDTLDGIDYKEIYADKNIINQGSTIKMDNITYLVVEKIYNYKNNVYDTGIIEPCQSITLNTNNIDCVVENLKADITNTNVVTFVDNKLLITLPSTFKIKINDQIEYKKLIYKIYSEDITKEGLTICKADYIDKALSYTIELTQDSATIEQEKTYTIVATVKDNKGLQVDNPSITYTSQNNTIATVNTTGLVTGVGIGSTTITLVYKDAKTIFNITVTEKTPQPQVTRNVEIVGNTHIKINTENTYTLRNLDIQEVITQGNYSFKLDEWTVENKLATIIGQNGYSCIVKGLKDGEQILLEVWLDNTKIENKDLTINLLK